ncbi:hypothetical protein CEK29_12855 [Bordetella genomosp. 5]|nr:hypothetical protein CEK29_12855 [Bordetella genomosp. 5]
MERIRVARYSWPNRHLKNASAAPFRSGRAACPLLPRSFDLMPFPRPTASRLSATPFALSALVAALAALAWVPVQAACTVGGSTATCSGAPDPVQPNFQSSLSNLFLTVTSDGVLASPTMGGNSALQLTGTGLTLTNGGVIDPQALTALPVPHQGVFMSNAAGSNQIIFNQGKIFGAYTGDQSVDGLAMVVRNGAGGRTVIENASGGVIAAKASGNESNILPSDALAIAAFGGAQVTLINRGTITGRVSLSSTGSNTVNNLGIIQGSVHLGPGGGHQFVASTDSSVTTGGGSAAAASLMYGGQNLAFARRGVVDAGAGGNSRLRLIQGGTTVGVMDVGNYLNFSTMDVEGGIWSLSGNASTPATTLFNGATVRIASGDALTAGTVTSRGGAIESSVTNSTMGFTKGLALESGITTFGAGDISVLNGGITGTGALRKTGSGLLFLSEAHAYTGGTYLTDGGISVSNAQAIGSGALTVGGSSNLRVADGLVFPSDMTLTTGSALTLVQNNTYTLGGAITGAGSLRKDGGGTATLTGANTYSGGTTITAGTVALDGAGTLAPEGGLTLSSPGSVFAIGGASGGRTIGALAGATGSQIQLGANSLTFGGPAGSSQFNGAFSGTGGIVKQGAATVRLGGANTHTGGTTITGGTLALTTSGALPQAGAVALLNAGSTLDLSAADGARQVGALTGDTGTRVVLNASRLTFGSLNQTDFNGSFSGDGAISTIGSVRLGGSSIHRGGTRVESGALWTTASEVLGSGTLDVTAGATLHLGGTTQTVSTLAGGGTITDVGELIVTSDTAQAAYSGTITGTGTLIKRGAGWLALTGVTSAAAAAVRVEAGGVQIMGSHQGNVEVNSGGTLMGDGSVNNLTVNAGGALLADRMQINGNLVMNAESRYVYTLGSPTLAPSDPQSGVHMFVAGNVTLDGRLDLNDPSGLGRVGYYRLMTHAGSRLGGGLQPGNYAPSLANQPVDILYDLAGHVDLRVGAAGSNLLQTWQGGSGTWNASSTNWSDDGSPLRTTWAGNHAVFNAAGGDAVNVSGTQAFAGLQFVSDGNQLYGGTLQTAAAGSEIRVLSGARAVIDTPIVGAGGIDKTEGGTLVLRGTNTYGDRTLLSGGVLEIDRRENLGGIGTRVQFNGGTLRIAGTLLPTLTAGIDWSANGGGFDIAEPGHTFLVDQVLVGGDLSKFGAGTLRLAGNQQYRDTYVADGTLIGDARSIRGNLYNAGTVEFEESGNATFAGAITGNGTLYKRGIGSLTLGGPSAGRWDIQAGTLVADATQYTGDTHIDGGATLNLSSASPATYAGMLGGTGAFIKTGGASLTLTGDSTAFSGTTLVQAGTLVVGAGGAGALGSTLLVANGGAIAGSGTVGNTTLANGARIKPGNGIGTLTVNGNLTFGAGAVYEVEADPDSSTSDRIDVAGHSSLAGSVLHVGPDGGFSSRREYTILTSNTIAGTFGAVSSDFAFLTPALSYDAHNVKLTLERKAVPVDPGQPGVPVDPEVPVDPVDPPAPPVPPVPTEPPVTPAPPEPAPTRPIAFEDAARSGNQRSVARALESLPAGSALHEFVLTLPDGAPPAVFNSLSGEAHAALGATLAQGAPKVRELPMARLRNNLNAGMTAGAPTAAAGMSDLAPATSALPTSAAQPVWAEIIGNWRTQDGNGNAASVREHTGGVFVGADQPIGAGWRLGGAFGYTDSKVKVRDRASQADVSSYSALIYGGRAFEAGPGAWNLMLGGGYTWHDISTRRNTLSQTAELTADYGASTAQLFTELGYRWRVTDRATLEPFAGVAWSDLRTRSFSESGGAAALSGQSTSTTQTTTTLGLRGTQGFEAAGMAGQLRATLGWRHAFGDLSPSSRLAFEGSQTFTVAGAPIARDAALLELGADVAVGRNTTLGVSYTGQLARDSREHGAQVNLRWRF